MIVKASNDALKHDYSKWKQRFGISDKWDFYFNPLTSWTNKYKSKIWMLLTPFSDIWHTLWTLWQFYFVYALMIEYGFWYGLGVGVAGVFIVFNGLYNFLGYKKFIQL
jgi:hypothetical protein